MNKINFLLREAVSQLSSITTTPHLDAELLLCHVLNCDRVYLFAHADDALSEKEYQDYQALVRQRQKKVPIAYLLGKKEFWNLQFEVNEHTLIPRPETEMLVELVLKYSEGDHEGPLLRYLDLGTGSGAIALALAKEKPDGEITAADISPEALIIAQKNASTHHITNVNFVHSNWFENITEKFDVIVSNPPYLDENDKHLINEEICHEPRGALVAANNGLADIEKIICEATAHLNANGLLLLEHGCDQGEAVREIFSRFHYRDIATHQDMAKLDRVTLGRV